VIGNVTGRDGYIIAKALAYAIEVIDALPKELRSLSDQADMKAILDVMIAQDAELTLIQASAGRHIRTLTGGPGLRLRK
jgi:hypothetical protein